MSNLILCNKQHIRIQDFWFNVDGGFDIKILLSFFSALEANVNIQEPKLAEAGATQDCALSQGDLTALKLLHYFKAQSGVELGELSLVINYSQVVLACHD